MAMFQRFRGALSLGSNILRKSAALQRTFNQNKFFIKPSISSPFFLNPPVTYSTAVDPEGPPPGKPTLAEVTQRVLKVVKAYDKVTADKLTLDSHFINDLGLDSLDHVEVIMAMEDEFGFEIPHPEVGKLVHVKDVIRYIADNNKTKSAPPKKAIKAAIENGDLKLEQVEESKPEVVEEPKSKKDSTQSTDKEDSLAVKNKILKALIEDKEKTIENKEKTIMKFMKEISNLETENIFLKNDLAYVRTRTVVERFDQIYSHIKDVNGRYARWSKMLEICQEDEPIQYILQQMKIANVNNEDFITRLKELMTLSNREIHRQILRRHAGLPLILREDVPEEIMWTANVIDEAYCIVLKNNQINDD